MVMALRRAILRVLGVFAEKKACSQPIATSMLNLQVLGTTHSLPPISPVASSMGRSKACRLMLAFLAFIHSRGGRANWPTATPSTYVEAAPDSLIRASLLCMYRHSQLPTH